MKKILTYILCSLSISNYVVASQELVLQPQKFIEEATSYKIIYYRPDKPLFRRVMWVAKRERRTDLEISFPKEDDANQEYDTNDKFKGYLIVNDNGTSIDIANEFEYVRQTILELKERGISPDSEEFAQRISEINQQLSIDLSKKLKLSPFGITVRAIGLAISSLVAAPLIDIGISGLYGPDIVPLMGLSVFLTGVYSAGKAYMLGKDLYYRLKNKSYKILQAPSKLIFIQKNLCSEILGPAEDSKKVE